jgi:hypothetical protein
MILSEEDEKFKEERYISWIFYDGNELFLPLK